MYPHTPRLRATGIKMQPFNSMDRKQ